MSKLNPSISKGYRKEEEKKFQETPYFKENARHRYKIGAKNSELKPRHGFYIARASGFFSMELQAATTIFVVNVKRNYGLNKYKITEEFAQTDKRFLGFHFIKSKRPIFQWAR